MNATSIIFQKSAGENNHTKHRSFHSALAVDLIESWGTFDFWSSSTLLEPWYCIPIRLSLMSPYHSQRNHWGFRIKVWSFCLYAMESLRSGSYVRSEGEVMDVLMVLSGSFGFFLLQSIFFSYWLAGLLVKAKAIVQTTLWPPLPQKVVRALQGHAMFTAYPFQRLANCSTGCKKCTLKS